MMSTRFSGVSEKALVSSKAKEKGVPGSHSSAGFPRRGTQA